MILMGINRLVGEEPISVTIVSKPTQDRTSSFVWSGVRINWYNPEGVPIIVRSVTIRMALDATVGGRLPYFSWNKAIVNNPSIKGVGEYGAANAAAPSRIGRYTWSNGADTMVWVVGGTDTHETHGIPLLTMDKDDWLAFDMLNGVIGDNYITTILYEVA